MSQEFNLRYNDIQPDSKADDNTQPKQSECVTYYETEGHARNVCFVLENGDRIFLNYAYLISGEYEHENGMVKLTFTTHFVSIFGSNLLDLCWSISCNLPMQIQMDDHRYKLLSTSNSLKISRIEVVNNLKDK